MSVKLVNSFGVLAVVALVVLAGCSGGGFGSNDAAVGGDGASGDAGDGLGYAVGGAQDVNNFRDNVEAGNLPIRSDMTHEGLFYDYGFETGDGDCSELFCPAYSRAAATDPLSNETDRYLSVGLNSNVSESEFERENLNLVVVLDVSGSMNSGMAEYHYDDEEERPDDPETRPKMDAATDAVVTLTEQLEDEDRFGLVTFESGAETAVPLERMDERDGDALADDVQSIEAGGGTNLAAGMDEASEMVEPHHGEEGYDTRVVYVTDAMPNLGDTSGDGLGGRLADDAERGIHSTFVGVGMDFNTETVETISSVRGANYYAVHSAETFEERMGEEFEYMVTPMVFDLSLELEAEGYEIENVYGSPEADEATGELLSTKTLFPSPTENGSTKGGVILLELERTGDDPTLELAASYEDRDGRSHETTSTVEFGEMEPDSYDDTAVRKAVLLERHATLLGNWVEYERAALADESPDAPEGGIESAETVADGDLGQWERQSTDLRVSPEYEDRLVAFRDHFEAEADAIGDETLEQELELLDAILETTDAGAETGTTDERTGTGTPEDTPTGTNSSVDGEPETNAGAVGR